MAPPEWTAPPFEDLPPFVTDAPQQPATTTGTSRTPQTMQTVVRVVTSTVKSDSGASETPSGDTVPHQSSPSSEGNLDMTTKALISVLAALILCILVAVVWRCLAQKIRQRKILQVGQQNQYYAPHYATTELESRSKRRTTTIVEVNGIRTPGELSVANSVYLGRYAPHLLKELEPAYFRRAESINSEKRELDAWSLHGWTTPKF